MPQVFGEYSPGGQFTTLAELYDPRLPKAHRVRFRRDLIPLLSRANALYVPSGRWPARGYILLRRADYEQLNPYSTSLALQIDDFIHPALTFRGLTVVQAQCVTAGVRGAADAIYLVEITDKRGTLCNQWFCSSTTSQFNAISPSYPGEYYSLTLNSTFPWTWSEMVGNLWTQMPILGSYPGLPSTPLGTPTNWIFPGCSCWEALNRILDHLGMQVTVDLALSSPYGIAETGGIDVTFTQQEGQYLDLIEDDQEYIDAGSGRVPREVVVYFHRRNEHYGTEETIRRDSLQWQSTPLYSVTVPASGAFASFASAAGAAYIWDDFTVRYDIDNNPLAVDVSTANAIAVERVQQFYTRIYHGTLGYLHRIYTGVLPFTAGSQLDGVAWRQDFRDQSRLGWRTEIIRGPEPPWQEVRDGHEIYQ